MQEIEHGGKLELGHNVKIGYFAQNQAQLLNEELTVFETIDYVAVGDIRSRIRDILGAFMFGGEASEKKVAALEEKLKAMEEQLSTPEGAGDMGLLQQYLVTKGELDKAMNNWEQSTLELDRFVG